MAVGNLLREIEQRTQRLTGDEEAKCAAVLGAAGWVDELTGVNKVLEALNIPCQPRDPEWQEELEQIFAERRRLDVPLLLYIVQREKEMHVRNETCHVGIGGELRDIFHGLGGEGDDGNLDAQILKDTVKHFGLTIDVDALVAKADANGSGDIDFEEFTQMLLDEETLAQQVAALQAEFRGMARAKNISSISIEALIQRFAPQIPYDYIRDFLEEETLALIRKGQARTDLTGRLIFEEADPGFVPRSHASTIGSEDSHGRAGSPSESSDVHGHGEHENAKRAAMRERLLKKANSLLHGDTVVLDTYQQQKKRIEELVDRHNSLIRSFRLPPSSPHSPTKPCSPKLPSPDRSKAAYNRGIRLLSEHLKCKGPTIPKEEPPNEDHRRPSQGMLDILAQAIDQAYNNLNVGDMASDVLPADSYPVDPTKLHFSEPTCHKPTPPVAPSSTHPHLDRAPRPVSSATLPAHPHIHSPDTCPPEPRVRPMKAMYTIAMASSQKPALTPVLRSIQMDPYAIPPSPLEMLMNKGDRKSRKSHTRRTKFQAASGTCTPRVHHSTPISGSPKSPRSPRSGNSQIPLAREHSLNRSQSVSWADEAMPQADANQKQDAGNAGQAVDSIHNSDDKCMLPSLEEAMGIRSNTTTKEAADVSCADDPPSPPPGLPYNPPSMAAHVPLQLDALNKSDSIQTPPQWQSINQSSPTSNTPHLWHLSPYSVPLRRRAHRPSPNIKSQSLRGFSAARAAPRRSNIH